jgi:uncharacterized protein (TIGR02145 family)/uncharacterized delta-60 repeat protein
MKTNLLQKLAALSVAIGIFGLVPPHVFAAAPTGTLTGTPTALKCEQASTALGGTLTVTDHATAPQINATNDLRIRIQSSTNAIFDTSKTSLTLGGTASAKASGTVSYPDSKTLLIDVTSAFAGGDTLTVPGLFLAGGTCAGIGSTSAKPLQWSVDGSVYGNGAASTNITVTKELSTTLSIDNEAPKWLVAGDYVTDNSDAATPTNVEDSVIPTTWTGKATDPNGDAYFMIICSEAGATAHNGAAPTCASGTTWGVSDSDPGTIGNQANASGSVATVTRIAQPADAQSNNWYAYACDTNAAAAACSVVSPAGSNPSPFKVNHRPVIGTVTAGNTYGLNSQITPGNDTDGKVFFQIGVSDPDDDTVQDTIDYFICPTASFDGTVCELISYGEGSGVATGTNAQNNTNTLVPIPTAHNAGKSFFIYLRDSHGLTDGGTGGTYSYTVKDVAPRVGTYTVNDISPVAGGSVATSFSVLVDDDNGWDDINTVDGLIYDDNTVNLSSGTCSANERNCYLRANCAKAQGSDTQIVATCDAITTWFNINPTGPGVWKAHVNAIDDINTTVGADSATQVAVGSLSAVAVAQNAIAYGSISVGGTSSSSQTTTLQNVGNIVIDVGIHGTDMSDGNSHTIPLGQQRWATTAGFTYLTGDHPLVADPESVPGTADQGCANQSVQVRATHDSTATDKDLFWKLRIPPTQQSGSYAGSNTFTSIADGLCTGTDGGGGGGDTCGDGDITGGESCDDGDADSGDGCSNTCETENNWICDGEPSVCTELFCGDSLIMGAESCDDGDADSGDGCSDVCQEEDGYSCSGEPSVCNPTGSGTCGDSVIEGGETCDDGNTNSGDGCSDVCATEAGYVSYGGDLYPTVVIGDQTWFKKNLNIGTRINGAGNQTDNSSIEKYCYGDSATDCTTYGGLYQWDEAMAYSEIEGAQGICPTGWHIPAVSEWDTLITYLGGASVAGDKMRAITDAFLWQQTDFGATDSSGFSALGTGYYDGSFLNRGLYEGFWSSSQADIYSAQSRYLSQGDPSINPWDVGRAYGFSVRCLMDTTLCGDSLITGGETCDDGDTGSGDGCSNACVVEDGYSCSGTPSSCVLSELLTDFGNYEYSKAMAIQADGKIVQVGYKQNSDNDFALTRINADRTLDTTFGTNGLVTTDFGGDDDSAQAVAIYNGGANNGKIVVAGNQGAQGSGTSNFALARYESDGSLDTGFGTDGLVTTDFAGYDDMIYGIAIDADGKIVVAGFASLSAGSKRVALARYESDGSLDTGFGTDGLVTTYVPYGTASSLANAVAIQSNGQIVVAGAAYNWSKNRITLARYESDGSLDTGFGTDGLVTTSIDTNTSDAATAVALDANGNIVVAGYSMSTITYRNSFALVRYTPSGDLDGDFNSSGITTTAIGSGTNDTGNAIAIQSDGKIVTAGSNADWNTGTSNFALTRHNTDGSLDNGFGTGGIISRVVGYDYAEAYSVLVLGNGTIVAGGDANKQFSDTDFALAWFGGSQPLASVSFQTITDFNGQDDQIRDVAIQPDGKMVATGYTWNGSDYDFAISRYNVDGTLDTGFGTNGKTTLDFSGDSDWAESVAILGNGDILVGGSSETGGVADFALARFDSNGILDTGFDGDGMVTTSFGAGWDSAKSMVVQDNGKIVLGGTASMGYDLIALARYNADGSLDGDFDTDGLATISFPWYSTDYTVNDIAVQDDGKIVVGGRGYEYAFMLTRVNIDGSVDTGFTDGFIDGLVQTPIGDEFEMDFVHSIAIQDDGKIVAVGQSDIGGNADFAVIRYNTDGSLDTDFSTDGIVVTPVSASEDIAYSVAIQGDGKIVASGTAYTNKLGSDSFNFATVRYNTNGSLDGDFGIGGQAITAINSDTDKAKSVTIQGDGKILVGGYSSDYGNDDFALINYFSDGTL